MDIERLGRLGVWTWLDHLSASEAAEFACQLEEWGYGALWIPEAVGRDPFSFLGYLAARSQHAQPNDGNRSHAASLSRPKSQRPEPTDPIPAGHSPGGRMIQTPQDLCVGTFGHPQGVVPPS